MLLTNRLVQILLYDEQICSKTDSGNFF